MRARQSCTKMAKLLTLQPWAINEWCNFTFDTKNQFLDPKFVGFGSLNVKIKLELTKLWQYKIFKRIPIHFLRNYYITFNPLSAPYPNQKKIIFLLILITINSCNTDMMQKLIPKNRSVNSLTPYTYIHACMPKPGWAHALWFSSCMKIMVHCKYLEGAQWPKPLWTRYTE